MMASIYPFSLSSSRFSLLFRHAGPKRICTPTNVNDNAIRHAHSVNVKPTPRVLIDGSTDAVAPAPIRHLARLRAAVADALDLGNMSTMKVLITAWMDIAAQAKTNDATIGDAICTFLSKVQPNHRTAAHWDGDQNQTVRSRACSIGKSDAGPENFFLKCW